MKIFELLAIIVFLQAFGWYINFAWHGKITFSSGLGIGLIVLFILSMNANLLYNDMIKDN
jgi:hypothetical protein